MQKPEDVTITQITAGTTGQGPSGHPSPVLFGLGSDEKVYFWQKANGWLLYQ